MINEHELGLIKKCKKYLTQAVPGLFIDTWGGKGDDFNHHSDLLLNTKYSNIYLILLYYNNRIHIRFFTGSDIDSNSVRNWAPLTILTIDNPSDVRGFISFESVLNTLDDEDIKCKLIYLFDIIINGIAEEDVSAL
jgi:hypothetical protein